MGLPDWMPGRPGGDPGRLRQIASGWDALNQALYDTERKLFPQADDVYGWWRGRAAMAYSCQWALYSSNLPQLHQAISAMSGHLRDAAGKIQDAQDQYDHYAEIAAGIAAAGIGLTIFTLGVSDLVAGMSEGGVIAAATAIIETLGAALEAIGGFIADTFATISTLVLELQLSLTPLQGFLLTGAAGGITFAGVTYASGDHNAEDVALAGIFGFATTADPGFGQGGAGDPVPALSGEQQALVDELQSSGVKIDPNAVVDIQRLPDGRIVWLESGNQNAGLQHIVEGHGQDFVNKGIPEDEIPGTVMDALRQDDVVGYQGKGTGRPIYRVTVNGQTQYIAITVGSNGFVVGANPCPPPKGVGG